MVIRVIAAPQHFPITPKDINVANLFGNAFDHDETEVSAQWIVRLCREKGNWAPFTYVDIDDFYTKYGPGDGFKFNELLINDWIVEEDNQYLVTHEFVTRCFLSSPSDTDWVL